MVFVPEIAVVIEAGLESLLRQSPVPDVFGAISW
jgi:hypothetical protein